MSNPIDEYFEMKKESTFWQGLTAAGDAAAAGRDVRRAGIQAAAAIGAAAAIPAGKAIVGALTKRHDYNKMMEHNPDLRDMKSENPKMFNQMYTSLRSANPEYGRDPLIAGSHMRKMMDQPEVSGLALTEAMRARPQPMMSFQLGTPKREGDPTPFQSGFKA